MPYSMDNPPEKIKGLPKHAKEVWIAAFNAALKEYDDEGKASATAWSAVSKAGYEKDKDGKWHKANAITELWENIKRLFAPLVADDLMADLQITLPTQTRTFTITRDAQGVPRWLMIAASAVVNKVGAIDSTVLFDNFIRHASESGEYPVLDFLHEGEMIRFGKADWLKRDDALYLASGGFDDTDLARAAIAGLEARPDYWGASIAYRVTQAPLILQAEGMIPVYTDGVNNFISIVPKRMAANLFTATLVAEEVKRMDAKIFEELVKLVGPERAAQFASQVDDANRTIADTGMVTRAEESAPEPAVAVAQVGPIEPEAAPAVVVKTRQETEPPAAPSDMDTIKAALAALAERVTKLEQAYGVGMEESRQTQERATSQLADIVSRLAAVEASKQRWDEWLSDAPEHTSVDASGIVRARGQTPALMTLAEIAAQNVGKLNKGPHYSRHGND